MSAKYTGYSLSQLAAICLEGGEDGSDALKETAWREHMAIYDSGVLATGVLTEPCTCNPQGGRPDDRNPPPPPPKRPGAGGGGGGTWEMVNDMSGDFIFVP